MEPAKSITIVDWLLISATIIGPIAAVQAQKWIERTREQRNRRLWIFQTLMATRAIRAGSTEHVQALNLIDLFFDGKSAKEKAVRTAWSVYLDFLMQRIPANMSDAEAASYNDKGIDFLVDLLDALARSLGYDFGKVQIKRGVYYPQGHADDNGAKIIIRDALVKVLTGEQPIPMTVIASEEALKSQKLLHQALLKTLSGEKPLTINTAEPLSENHTT